MTTHSTTPPAPTFQPIAELLARAGTASATDSYQDYIRSRERGLGGGVAGCALVAGQVVHLTAFPAQQASGAPDAG